MGLIHEEKTYAFKIRESANDGSDFTNPEADYRIVFLGEDGEWHSRDSAGTVAGFAGSGIAPTIFAAKGDVLGASANDTPAILSVGANGLVLTAASGETTGLKWAVPVLPSARATRTAGSITTNNTSWTNVDTGIDLTIAAATGDVLLVQLSDLAGASTPTLFLDAATIVSASPVNYVSGGASEGLMAWCCPSGVEVSIGGGAQYVVQSGDISGGNVVLRLRYKSSFGANRTLYATANDPLHWSVVNLGH